MIPILLPLLGTVALKQRMRGGWCNDFYRSQIWYRDHLGRITCLVGAHKYVLHYGNDKKVGLALDEECKSNVNWNIRETTNNQFEIQCITTNQIIDASKGNTDIRVINVNKKKKKKKNDDVVYHWNSSFDENWPTTWLLTDNNGSKVRDIESSKAMETDTYPNQIDINAVDRNKMNVLAHAIIADEHGIDSVR